MESMSEAMLAQIASVATESDGNEPCPNCGTPIALTPNMVARMLSARESIIDGDPIGTVRMGPEGEIATRVNDKGMHVWRVVCPDGTVYNDLQPSMHIDWKVIKEGTDAMG